MTPFAGKCTLKYSHCLLKQSLTPFAIVIISEETKVEIPEIVTDAAANAVMQDEEEELKSED